MTKEWQAASRREDMTFLRNAGLLRLTRVTQQAWLLLARCPHARRGRKLPGVRENWSRGPTLNGEMENKRNRNNLERGG